MRPCHQMFFAVSGGGGTETSDLSTPNKNTTSARSTGRSNIPKLLNAKRIEATNAITLKVQMELKNAQETKYEDVEDQIYELRDKLRKVGNDIIKVTDKEILVNLKRYHHHMKKKLARALKKRSELKSILSIVESDTDSDNSLVL